MARKPLRVVHGRPLVLHVLERAGAASCVSRVVLATDSEEVAAVGTAAGFEVAQTGPAHNGTERVALALAGLDGSPDVVVNVQGDQPALDPSHVDAAAALVLSGFEVATVCAPLVGDPERPSRVKAVVGADGRALYFSRAPVPHGGPYWLHLGVYAFTPRGLARCVAAPSDGLAASERLEQLAWLEAGIAMGVARVARATPAVDEERDLVEVGATLRR